MDTRTAAEKAAAHKAQVETRKEFDGPHNDRVTPLTADRPVSLTTAEERRDAAANRARRRPAFVGPLTARLAVENEALAIEERAAQALDDAEAEVGDDNLWWLLTQIFRPDSLTRLLAECRAQVTRFDADAETAKAEAKAKPAVKAEKGAVAVAEPEVVVADPAEGTLNRFLARAIVAATESDNRP